MREAGDVCYADVFRDGTGVVEFVRKEDMTYAVRKLDNTKFRSHEVGSLLILGPELDTQGLTMGAEGKEVKAQLCQLAPIEKMESDVVYCKAVLVSTRETEQLLFKRLCLT